ncbi:hypothetical protein GWI33_019300 [Rhynchophorus ferrugineus]|uniref:Uncharacterized protein n=1 Tax=Rhynchophorus ferrugineus TaxID=354439 RepID=A0A834M5F2_RHYFE|nr:hypothetical protein GWI33_019300 [Rhynchophorus ferrugineus]
MDIAYIYSWKRKSPLDLTYKIYECPAKKPKLEQSETSDHATLNKIQHNNNNNNWKEVQLRISENGEMSITGIQDALVLDIPEKEIVINEGKLTEEGEKKGVELDAKEDAGKPAEVALEANHEIKPREPPDLKFIGKTCPEPLAMAVSRSPPITLSSLKASELVISKNNTDALAKSSDVSSIPKNTSLSTVLNLTNNELSVIPLTTTKACTTTTVFSTINKTMCSTKPAEKPNQIIVDSKATKRKSAADDKGPPMKLPKPTILNHSIAFMNLSNNHPLKRHKLNRNGETVQDKPTPTTSLLNNASTIPPKPIVINKSVSGITLQKPSGDQKAATTPCYVPKPPTEKNDGRQTTKTEANFIPKTTAPSHHVHPIHIPIITPAQLPHNQILNAHHAKTTSAASNQDTTTVTPVAESNLAAQSTIKTKPSTPIGYKTLRDPPKSWNSQINLQIAKTSNAQNRQNSGDLKNVRPPKFFKGRNIPRYLGNPASGVKPMYQVHVSPEKDKNHTENAKVEKREIKKHSIVKIDPKTLKPISEKAPETSNLSNVSTTSGLQANQELSFRLNSTPNDLKINTSSVSIFNPLKLQSSPKGDRKSPKSPHSPKVKVTSCASASAYSPSLSPKQQRDKTNLTFTPPNPFVPNLASPTLGPAQWAFPGSYDPRMLMAYNMWYNHQSRMAAAAAAAGLVPQPMSHSYGLNMAMKSHVGGQVPPKHVPASKNDSKKTLETALEKLSQNKAKELVAAAKTTTQGKSDTKPNQPTEGKEKTTDKPPVLGISNTERKEDVKHLSKKDPAEVPHRPQAPIACSQASFKEGANTEDTKVTKYDSNSNKPLQNDVKPTVNGDQAVNKEESSAPINPASTPDEGRKNTEGNDAKAKEGQTVSDTATRCNDKDVSKSDKLVKDGGDGVGDREVKGSGDTSVVREKLDGEQNSGS